MRIENTLEVPAPPDQAWQLLNDLSRVVPCMPGAALTEVVDQDTLKVAMSVKLGAIALKFLTDVKRSESDAGARRIAIHATGRELRGRGSAQATIEAQLSDLDGGTRVEIVTDLSLQGSVAQYGRGIVLDVTQSLTKQFAARLADQIEQSPAGAG